MCLRGDITCIYVYVCIYIHIYIYILYLYIRIHKCIYTCNACTYVHICRYICIYIYTCMYVVVARTTNHGSRGIYSPYPGLRDPAHRLMAFEELILHDVESLK